MKKSTELAFLYRTGNLLIISEYYEALFGKACSFLKTFVLIWSIESSPRIFHQNFMLGLLYNIYTYFSSELHAKLAEYSYLYLYHGYPTKSNYHVIINIIAKTVNYNTVGKWFRKWHGMCWSVDLRYFMNNLPIVFVLTFWDW